MTTREKLTLAIESVEILVAALRSTANQFDILVDAAKRVVAEYKRFEEEVPHQTSR